VFQRLNLKFDKLLSSFAFNFNLRPYVQAVHYLWAMQLSNKDLKTADGREYSAPTWQLREMVLRGMMAIT